MQSRTLVFTPDDDALQMLHVNVDGLRIMEMKIENEVDDDSIWTVGGFAEAWITCNWLHIRDLPP